MIKRGDKVKIKPEHLKGYYKRFSGKVGEVRMPYSEMSSGHWLTAWPVAQAGRWYRQTETNLWLSPDWLEILPE